MEIHASAGREGQKNKVSFDSFCVKMKFDANNYTDAVRLAALVRVHLTGHEKNPLVITAVDALRAVADEIVEENKASGKA